MPIDVLPQARRELRDAAAWYESKQADLGEEFLDEVGRALEEIADAPSQFPRWCDDRPYRKALVTRFPYVVFFVERPGEVRVLAVAHVRRRPGYWVSRGR